MIRRVYKTAKRAKVNVKLKNLHFLTTGAHAAECGRKADPINRAYSVSCRVDRHPPPFLWVPKSFFGKVGVKTAPFDAGDLQANPFLLFRNSPDGITLAADGNLPRDLTLSWHKSSLKRA